jgi:hypothetical protein
MSSLRVESEVRVNISNLVLPGSKGKGSGECTVTAFRNTDLGLAEDKKSVLKVKVMYFVTPTLDRVSDDETTEILTGENSAGEKTHSKSTRPSRGGGLPDGGHTGFDTSDVIFDDSNDQFREFANLQYDGEAHAEQAVASEGLAGRDAPSRTTTAVATVTNKEAVLMDTTEGIGN